MQPGSPVGGREGMDNDQVQLQEQEKISQEEAKELKQVEIEKTFDKSCSTPSSSLITCIFIIRDSGIVHTKILLSLNLDGCI